MPNVKNCRLLLLCVDALQTIEAIAKRQTLQTAGKLGAFQAVVDVVAKHQSLQTAG